MKKRILSLAMAACRATLCALVEEDMGEHVIATGKHLRHRLEAMPHVTEVRGRGLMRGAQLDVPAATALVGTMLSIKPVMHTDNEGRLTMVGKARGRKASLKALLDAIERLAIEPEKQTMFICHADCQEEAKQVAAEIQRRFGTTDIRIHYIGPVIGSHTGPNTMGLFFVGTER